MADLFPEVVKSIASLTDEQREQLLAILEKEKSGIEKAKEQGLLVEDKKVVACPHCGSADIRKRGHVNEKQRYQCKDCKKTFTSSTGTIYSHSRLNREQWQELIKGMVLNLSLTKIADIIGVSTKTAWYNRQRVYDAILELHYGEIEKPTFRDIAECDEFFVHLSFKGKRNPEFFINHLGRMPRKHRSRLENIEYLKEHGLYDKIDPVKLEELLTGDRYLPWTNRDSVCILTCRDRSNNLLLAPTCVGNVESKHIAEKLKDTFAPDAILVTDSNNSYNSFAEFENIHHEQILASKHAKGPYNLSRINSLHSRLDIFWSRNYHLPATKYIDLHLAFFWWLEKNSQLSTVQKIDKLHEILQEQLYDKCDYHSLTHRPLPLDTKGVIPDQV